jgi:hypothetical protein
VNLNPAGPTVVPANLTYWDALTKTLYATNPGSVTITWNFTNAPPSAVVSVGYITPIETTVNLGQEIIPPACADTAQAPTGTGIFWHTQTSKLYATTAGTHTIRWKRAGNPLLTIPQQITALWPTSTAQFQIHVAKSAPVDVTGGGSFGSPTLLTQDAEVGATLTGNLFATTNAGRSLYLVSAPGASAQFTNIYFQFVQSINWNDSSYLRDTNIAIIGEEISHPEHNPACGAPYVMDYLTPASPARVNASASFYNPTNRTGPIIPVNRSPNGTRSTDLLLALYQFGTKLIDPLTGSPVPNAVAWPYLPVRYLCNWPTSPETIFIAGGQGSGPVALSDPNWNVYRQPDTNQLGYNPNEEHAFRFAAAPTGVQLEVNFSSLSVVAGTNVPVTVSLVGDTNTALQGPVTVTVTGARDGDTNLFVQYPINGLNQELVFYPTNWSSPQTISFVANTNLGSGTNLFVVRAAGGLVSQTRVEVHGIPTNQLNLALETTAIEITENASRSLRMRLTQAPTNSVTVITSPRGSINDSPDLSVASGATLVFNAGNWSVPQSVTIQAAADADNGNDTAVFNVQASGGLTTNLTFTATQIDDTIIADAVYALRNDLGDTNNAVAPKSSEPYVLLKYTNAFGLGQMKVYKVLAEDATHKFVSSQKAGELLRAPNPLRYLEKCPSTVAVSGPYFRDKYQDHWAKAAGISNGIPVATNIIVRYYYKPNTTTVFDPPIGTPSYTGNECLPWLDKYAQTLGEQPGNPVNYNFNITWPDNVPELRVGETLIKPKFGLPNIADQCSVDVVYEQAGAGTMVQLYDPLAVRVLPVNNLPTGLPPEIVTQLDPTDQKLIFMQAPLTLRNRIKFNTNTSPPQLEFKGYYNDTDYVGEPLLLPNIMTTADANALKDLAPQSALAYRADIDALRSITIASGTGLSSLDSQFKALSAASPAGQGYVALAMQNSTNCSGLPVSIEIFKVTCPLYRGDIKAIHADCAFDESLTLRHSADFAGNGDNYEYAWFYRPVGGSTNWIPDTGQTNQDLTIKGSGLRTLQDYEYYCQYRPVAGPVGPCGTNWSAATTAQLAEGWIKRVLRGVNPFTQITSDFHDSGVNTTADMIQQAGSRWEGSIALNCSPGNQFGLIEAYETVLRRGMGLSISEGIALTNDTALRLASAQLSDLYLLLGNEAYADAQDPTVGATTVSADSQQYSASFLFCFQGQTPSLLQEELILLRGRDGPFGSDASVGTRTDVAPVYNRLYWNYGPDAPGQAAYALNYNITDKDGIGAINATDARIMFPQGHGDAWGHYLSSIKSYYRLFSNSNYTWLPEIEIVNINGAPVQVNYQHERKFAKIAAARARTAAEIVNLTYRSQYVEDPAGQWQGYRDANTNRAWGVTEWASRGGRPPCLIGSQAILSCRPRITPAWKPRK